MCAKIVTVLNRKGGVGKTTLTIAIADTLISEHEANVAIVDLDPQATASQVLLGETEFRGRAEGHDNLYGLMAALLTNEQNPDKHRFRIDGLGKIAGHPKDTLRLYPNSDAFWDLEAAEIGTDNGIRLNEAVTEFLQREKQDRHYILVDCPPGQSITAQAVLKASDIVICPMNPDHYSVWGKELLKRYLNRVAPQTHFKFVINRYNQGINIHNRVLNELRGTDHEPDMLVVTEGQRSGQKQDLAIFSVNSEVMRRLDLNKQKPLYRIYGNRGEQQLKKIIDAILKELGQDG
jgi:chromosome partitioning protein